MIKKKATGEGDDMVFDDADSPPAGGDEPELEDIEGDFKGELKKMKEKLAACQQERQEYLDGWQRAKADYLNSQRRAVEEREREAERQTARFIEKILPLADSFDRAMEDIKKQGSEKRILGASQEVVDGFDQREKPSYNLNSSCKEENWRAGVEQIYNQLAAVLKSYDVEALEPAGAPFDPHFHEAVSEIPVEDAARDHTVLEVLQKGYRMGERLVRPAKVVVGTYQK
ncbi:nucleotide exchange factor GrpE [Candidatus Kaiserbacteria bacterium]|nr:nucleotide exchange factor GrpE [Candidatus Kaiserbacteria bacterium]